jgi:hypothetical protein
MRLVPALCALILALPLAARADEAVATAAGAGAPPTATATTADQIDAFIRSAPPPKLDDGTPAGVVPPERKVHGEVGVAVGSGGYRSAYVTSVMPVGETGTLALAVSQTKYGKNGGPGWGPGYGYGYGPGTRSTVGMSLALGEAAQAGCRGRARGYEPYGLEEPMGLDHARCREHDADR